MSDGQWPQAARVAPLVVVFLVVAVVAVSMFVEFLIR